MSDSHDAGNRLEELLAQRDPEAPSLPDEVEPEPTDVEPEAPEDALPDAPLFALLRTVEQEIAVDRIDRVWIFPPRRLEAGETAVVVVAAFPDLDEGRRRVYAAHYAAPQGATPQLALQEFGTAPTERIGRVVEEVVERLKDEPAAAPQAAHIQGDDLRWAQLLHDLAERHLDAAGRHPRLQRDPRRQQL